MPPITNKPTKDKTENLTEVPSGKAVVNNIENAGNYFEQHKGGNPPARVREEYISSKKSAPIKKT